MDKENGWDASANWNGYMYQGKVALLVALTKINEISDVTEFWLESEGIEDFSIGKGKGEKKEYESVHQVKNRKDNKMENYNEALSNIVKRIRDYPGIKRGFLHIKNEIITDNWKKEITDQMQNYYPQKIQELNAIVMKPELQKKIYDEILSMWNPNTHKINRRTNAMNKLLIDKMEKENNFQKKEDADRVAADCMERMCEVEKDDVKEKTVRPPKLYDLTTLQREANRMFGYTAQQTLDAVQEMYEQKLVTYPRTDSQYLTDEMGESTETLIQMLLGKMPYAEGLEYQPDVSKVLNSKKVSDHHAIIPTVEVAKADIGKLKERNCKILYLISARVLTATADPYIYESHKCQITCNYHTFYLTAKKTKQEGFKSIENKLKQFFGVKSEKEEPELDIWDGKHYGPCDSFVSEHFTQPPKQYTEDTLLSAMERAGNEELTEDTEKKGLGTPATRAAIIEKLIQSGFVKREKKNLVPTDDGNVLITVLPDEIKSPKMTAEWEMALNHIAQNTETADEFLNGITELMQELVARYQGISEEKKEQFQGKAKGEVIGKCPRCGADVREGKVNFYCSDRNCAFTLWKNDKFLASQGKRMDKTTAKKFLSKGKIHYKDLVSRKTGRQYEATVEMVDPGEGNVQFNLSFPQR